MSLFTNLFTHTSKFSLYICLIITMKLFVCCLLDLNFVILINRVINQIHYSKFKVFGDFSYCDSLVEIHPSVDFSKFYGTET